MNALTPNASLSIATSDTRFGALRSVSVDGQVWFVAADVCKALGLKNTGMALANLATTDVGEIRLSVRGGRPHKLVNETGMYELVFQSRKPNARAFRRFLSAEVIPSLLKHGMYVVGQERMTDDELRSTVNSRGERLIAGTKEQRHLSYQREIARIEATGRRATSWEQFVAGKP